MTHYDTQTSPEFPAEILLSEMIRSYRKAFPNANVEIDSPARRYLETCASALHVSGHTAKDVRGVVFHRSGVHFFTEILVEFPEFTRLLEE